jgi:hypothetical protein
VSTPDPTIVAWLHHIATSPPGSTFAMLGGSSRRALDRTLYDMRALVPEAVRYSTSGPCLVFGRRVHLLRTDRPEQVRGLGQLAGVYVHPHADVSDDLLLELEHRVADGAKWFREG